MSAAFVMVMFPVSSSIWKMFPSFPEGGGKDKNLELAVNSEVRPSVRPSGGSDLAVSCS